MQRNKKLADTRAQLNGPVDPNTGAHEGHLGIPQPGQARPGAKRSSHYCGLTGWGNMLCMPNACVLSGSMPWPPLHLRVVVRAHACRVCMHVCAGKTLFKPETGRAPRNMERNRDGKPIGEYLYKVAQDLAAKRAVTEEEEQRAADEAASRSVANGERGREGEKREGVGALPTPPPKHARRGCLPLALSTLVSGAARLLLHGAAGVIYGR